MEGLGVADDEGISDVRVELVRIQERQKHFASREEMNTADTRILTDVSGIFERTHATHREYVRDRVRESALEIKSELTGIQTAVAALTTAVNQINSAPAQPQASRGIVHPVVAYTGGGITGASLLYMILNLVGQVHG